QRLPRAPELGRITKSDGREDTDTGDSEYRDGNPRRVQLHDGRIATRSSFSGSQRISPARDWKRPRFVLTPEWPDLDTCTQKHLGRPKIEGIGTVLNVEAWCSTALARVANDLNDHRGRAYEEECVEGRVQDFLQSHQHL